MIKPELIGLSPKEDISSDRIQKINGCRIMKSRGIVFQFLRPYYRRKLDTMHIQVLMSRTFESELGM
jgi:hypothetical protein